MPVVTNPLLAVISPPPKTGTDRTDVRRLWDVVESCAMFIRALFTGVLFEFHEEEPVDSTGVLIRHALRRRPFGLIVLRNSGPRNIVTDYERWDAENVHVATSAGSVLLTFVLF